MLTDGLQQREEQQRVNYKQLLAYCPVLKKVYSD